MKPKSFSKERETSDIHLSPFEQITTLENEQEARVQQAIERFEQEKHDAEKSIVGAEKTQEEMMRAKATDELKEYARTEPANILTNAEQQTSDELKTIAKHAEKELPKALTTLTSSLLDGSLFSTAA